jgi:hypothetical protein
VGDTARLKKFFKVLMLGYGRGVGRDLGRAEENLFIWGESVEYY